jgi:hypothetical protein
LAIWSRREVRRDEAGTREESERESRQLLETVVLGREIKEGWGREKGEQRGMRGGGKGRAARFREGGERGQESRRSSDKAYRLKNSLPTILYGQSVDLCTCLLVYDPSYFFF